MRVMALLIAVAIAGCGASVSVKSGLDTGRAEDLIREGIVEQTGVAVSAVECPDDVTAEKGTRFACTARGADGTSAPVAAVASDDEGNVEWSADLVNQGRVKGAIAEYVAERLDAEAADVDCPDVVELRAGRSFECALALDGSKAVAEVTLRDDEGAFSLSVEQR